MVPTRNGGQSLHGWLPRQFKKFGLDEESDDDDLGLAKDGDEEEAVPASPHTFFEKDIF